MDIPDSKQILSSFLHIAVVGISPRAERPSNSVARYMLQHGYIIYPVNPAHEKIIGLSCYPSLSAMPPEISKKIEIVNIFRKSSDIAPIVDEAIGIGAKVIWMQLGIHNEAEAQKARKAGLVVVENLCIALEHQHFFQ